MDKCLSPLRKSTGAFALMRLLILDAGANCLKSVADRLHSIG